MRNITILWLFCCPVLSCPVLVILFSRNRAQVEPLDRFKDFNRLWLKWRVFAQGCAFWGFCLTIHNYFKAVQTPWNPKKGAWLGIIQPNWQNHKIAISPTTKVRSTPYIVRVIELHNELRGWSRILEWQKSSSRWRTAVILENVGNAITRLPMDRYGLNLGWSHPVTSRRIRYDAVAMATAVA